MANILKWLGDAAHNVERAVGGAANNVAHAAPQIAQAVTNPVGAAVNYVVDHPQQAQQQVQQVAQTAQRAPGFVYNNIIKPQAINTYKTVGGAINPMPAFHQTQGLLTHNPRLISQGIAEQNKFNPLARSGGNYSAAAKNIQRHQNPTSNLLKGTGELTNVVATALPLVGFGGRQAGASVAKKVLSSATKNAGYGAVVGAGQGAQSGSLRETGKQALAGAAVGGALGGGGELLAHGAVLGSKGAVKANQALGQGGYIAGPGAKRFEQMASNAKTRGQSFEQSDAGLKIKSSGAQKVQAGATVPLSDVIKHPQLKADYPHFFDRQQGLKVTSDTTAMHSTIDKNTGLIRIAKAQVPNLKSEVGKSKLVHEIQHAVDNAEGRSSGTTPAFELGKNIPQSSLDASKRVLQLQPQVDSLKALKRAGNISEKEFNLDPSVVAHAKATKIANAPVESTGLSPQEKYLANEGELRAGAAEARRGLSQKQIDANPQDIAGIRRTNEPQPRYSASSAPDPTRQLPPKVQGATTNEYVDNLAIAAKKAREAGPSPVKIRAAEIASEAKRKLVDSNAPIEDILNKAIKGGAKVPTKDNITYQIDRVLRAPTLAGQFLQDHGLDQIIKNVDNVDEFNQFLIAKHAQDLQVKAIRTGRNDLADAQLIKDLGPKYNEAAKAVNQYSQKLLDYSIDRGLISKELGVHLKAEYPNYVPINRIFSESERQNINGGGKSVASIGSQSVVQKLKGSDRQIENPLESLLAKTNDAFQQGEKNDAARMLAGYRDLPGNPFGLKELQASENVGARHTISYLDNGVKRTFETTKEVSEAAKSMNREQLGFVGQIFAVPTRVLRLGATGVNLPFIGANIVKDQATAFINSNRAASTSLANPANFIRALVNAVGHGKEYHNLLRAGAGGTSFDIARDAAPQTIARIRAGRSPITKIAYTAIHPGELLRAVEDTVGRSEELGRIQNFTGTRDALLKEGRSLEEANTLAAHAARNNSTNFSRAGDYGRVANTLLPYLNAGVQGSRVFLRNLQNRPAQTGAKLALTVFTPMAALTAWNVGDPVRKQAYDNIRDYEKENNFIIIPPNPTQDSKGRWNVIKIPMSQEVANLASIVRKGVESLRTDSKFNFAEMAGNLAGSVTSLNTQGPRQLLGQFTPQAVKPGLEMATNTNLFTGAPIVPNSLKNYPTNLQYRPNTSGTAVKIGQAVGASPLQVENFAATAGGGVGRQLLNTSDHALSGLGIIQPNQVGGQEVVDAIGARFNKAQGQTAKSLQYQQEQDKQKADNAKKVPKALVAAGLEKSDILTGNDALDKAQARINAAKKKTPGLSETSQKAIINYARLTELGRQKLKNNPEAYLAYNKAKLEEAKLAGNDKQVAQYSRAIAGPVSRTRRAGRVRVGRARGTTSSGPRRTAAVKSNKVPSLASSISSTKSIGKLLRSATIKTPRLKIPKLKVAKGVKLPRVATAALPKTKRVA